MTPGERLRWATHDVNACRRALWAAQEDLAHAEMEHHYARFIQAAASAECATCHAVPGAYCALFRRADGTYGSGVGENGVGHTHLFLFLFLHPSRTTTPEALAAAQ